MKMIEGWKLFLVLAFLVLYLLFMFIPTDQGEEQYRQRIKLERMREKQRLNQKYGINQFNVDQRLPAVTVRPNTSLLLVVPTMIGSRASRDVMRQTVGSVHPARNQIVFFVGQNESAEEQDQLVQEAQQYHDIVQPQVLDAYRDLTLKTLSMYYWILNALEPNNGLQWIGKMDDDVLLNIYRAEDYLGNADRKRSMTYHCKVFFKQSPIRQQDSKWYTSVTDWNEDRFPPYCSGPNYFFTPEVVKQTISSYEENTDPILWSEDVFVTGVLARDAGIDHVHVNDLAVTYQSGKEDNFFSFHMGAGDLKNNATHQKLIWQQYVVSKGQTTQVQTSKSGFKLGKVLTGVTKRTDHNVGFSDHI